MGYGLGSGLSDTELLDCGGLWPSPRENESVYDWRVGVFCLDVQ